MLMQLSASHQAALQHVICQHQDNVTAMIAALTMYFYNHLGLRVGMFVTSKSEKFPGWTNFAAFCNANHVHIEQVTVQDLYCETISFHVLYVPGGLAKKQAEALQDKGRQRVQQNGAT